MKRWLRWIFWFALIISLLMHVAILVAEPLYQWFMQPEFSQTELRKNTKQLDAQSLDDEETKPAELANVKPAEKQVVYLQPIQPVVLQKPQPKRVVKKSLLRASAVSVIAAEAASATTIDVAASAMQVELVAAASAASAVSVVANASRVAASSASSVHLAEKASAASAAARIATQIDREASKRFPKVVEIGYYWGVFDARMTWKIERGQYDLKLETNPLGKKMEWVSAGKIDKNGVIPASFADYRNGSTTPKNSTVFDWQQGSALTGAPNQQKSEPIEVGDQDFISAALHLALMGNKHPAYEMALFSGRKRYPEAKFELKGEATLTLSGQKIDAVLMQAKWGDRQVDFWLAPQWSNLPVKMTLKLGDDGSFDILAKEVTLDGKKVLEWINPQDQRHRRP